MAWFYDTWQEHCDHEEGARYDYLREAYFATAQDAYEFALSEAEAEREAAAAQADLGLADGDEFHALARSGIVREAAPVMTPEARAAMLALAAELDDEIPF